MKRTVISEYVGIGHPDKVADQISDALLDEFLRKNPNTRAGIEVMIKDNVVVLGGEVKSTAQIDYDHIVRETMDRFRYPEDHHLSGDDIKVIKVPATDIANELNNHRGTNIIMLGALAGASELYDVDEVREGMNHYFDKKGKNNPKNVAAFDAGAEAAAKQV